MNVPQIQSPIPNADIPVLLVATMDTKETEALYIKDCLLQEGLNPMIMDGGILGQSPQGVEYTRDAVALAAGKTIFDVRNSRSEGEAMNVMVSGAVQCALSLYNQGRIHGIIGLGGSMGTTLCTGVMRSLPLGFPKVMISSMASGNTRPFVGTKDILMLNSMSDLAGLNRITRRILKNGALALAGMTRNPVKEMENSKYLAVLTALGTSEACAAGVRKELTERGVEILAFHTTGSGGETMERMIREEKLNAVIDLSLHELMDHHFGGNYDAGPSRCRAVLQADVPTIFAPGNIDFLVTGPLELAKKKFPGRRCHMHNANITCVRTDLDEIRKIAGIIAGICNESNAPVAVLVPLKGFSGLDREGAPLYDPDGPRVFAETVGKLLTNKKASLQSLPYHLNDRGFIDAVLETLTRIAGLPARAVSKDGSLIETDFMAKRLCFFHRRLQQGPSNPTPANTNAPPLITKDATMQGRPASPGVTEGPCVVVDGPGDFSKIKEGSILIFRKPDPRIFSYIPMIKALITNHGGILSRAATIARECDIPAVAAAGAFVNHLEDGVIVRVDGNAGTVEIRCKDDLPN